MVNKLGSVSKKIAGDYLWRDCSERFPEEGFKYHLLLDCKHGDITYHSMGIAWEDGVETRAARPVNGAAIVEYYRSKDSRILILHNKSEFKKWREEWGGLALIERSVWAAFNSF